MKKLLSYAGSGLITSAFLDPLIQSGLGKPVLWWRDVLMVGAGIACLYILIKYGKHM